jgi:hypothetical protein
MSSTDKKDFCATFLNRVHGFSRKVGKEYFELVASEMRKVDIKEFSVNEILTLHVTALAEMAKSIIAIASCSYLDAPIAKKKEIAKIFVRGYAEILKLPEFMIDIDRMVDLVEEELSKHSLKN